MTNETFSKNLKISQLVMAGLQLEAINEAIDFTNDEINESLKSIKYIINSEYSAKRLNANQLKTLQTKRKIFKNVKKFRKDSEKINNSTNYIND